MIVRNATARQPIGEGGGAFGGAGGIGGPGSASFGSDAGPGRIGLG